ncbi:MAG: thioredoxin domain-containing protein [Gammaproteobacteria bacterium]
MSRTAELNRKINDALAAKGPDYRPRTRHLHEGRPIYCNRLIFEDSPYLLQHAHNPVDWHPWGEEAFELARLRNKPIFLSIGYATCHWCHVMEEESFENTVVADLLNEHFIAIKVDREQYPDVDQTYMTAVQMLTGHGGWPMSSFLTPTGKPFFGGTYYPTATFIDLLSKVHSAWEQRHETLLDQAERVADAVREAVTAQGELQDLSESAVETAVNRVLSRYDDELGGFSGAPKFPNEPLLLLLLHYSREHREPRLLHALNHTLTAMAHGGIYDQVGGGFHRYSVDRYWLVPHFEKMLYNQAYLSEVYSQAYRITGDPLYARVLRQTLDYVLRDMRTEHGLFYSATDADSEGHEGTYFVWTRAEIESALGVEDAEFVVDLFGVTAAGNFEGRTILHWPLPPATVAECEGIDSTALWQRLDPLLATLRSRREQRVPPLTDTKIITAWNGMLIAALVEASDSLNESAYLQAAERSTAALWHGARPEAGRLWRVQLNGTASIAARQDDYAHFADALLALYDATGGPRYLEQARELADEMTAKFADSASGALVMGRDDLLFTQPKDAYDGALPSGNAVAVRVLARLAARTGDGRYGLAAQRILRAFAAGIERQPEAYAYMLAQADQLRHGESGICRYAAGGAVKLEAKLAVVDEGHALLRLTLTVREGWHINGPESGRPSLVAAKLNFPGNEHWQPETIDYPEAVLSNEGYEGEAQPVYQGKVVIKATLVATNVSLNVPVKVDFRLQACSQDACLAPETATVLVFPEH